MGKVNVLYAEIEQGESFFDKYFWSIAIALAEVTLGIGVVIGYVLRGCM